MPNISLLQSESWPNSVRTLLQDLGDSAGSHGLVIAAVPLTIVDGVPVLGGGDDIVPSQVTIAVPHKEVHDGDTYQASYKSPEGSDVADNGTVLILYRVTTSTVHFTFEPACGGDMEVELFEGVTVSSTGAAILNLNMSRISANIRATDVFITPVVLTWGTRLHHSLAPGGQKNFAGGAVARQNTERILRLNTDYVVRLTNRSGAVQPMSIVLQGYEI